MPVKGAHWGSKYGPDFTGDSLDLAASTTFAMGTTNAVWAARFMATETSDVASVRLRWSSVTTAAACTLTIQTDNAGVPSGTNYDSNASISITPVAGNQEYTFATQPSTGLTLGAYYYVVLTTTGSGSQNLTSHVAANYGSAYPTAALTGTTSSVTEVSGSLPIASLVLANGNEDSMGMSFIPALSATVLSLYTNSGSVIGAGLKFTTNVTLNIAGYEAVLNKNGTPTSNIVWGIYNGTSLVSGSSVTVKTEGSMTANAKRMQALLSSVLSLAAGTYRLIAQGASDTSTSNCWRLLAVTPWNAASAPSGFLSTTAPNMSSPSFTDSATNDQPFIRLLLDDIPTPSGGGGMPPFMRVM